MTRTVQAAANWAFRDRSTGKIVIAQWPNVPLGVWLISVVAARLFHPHGSWSGFLTAVSAVSLVIWAADEIGRGVNPWRRALGASVLIGLLVEFAMS